MIASIAKDLSRAIDESGHGSADRGRPERGPSVPELIRRMEESGGTVPAPASGYLQFVRHETLIRIAAEADAVIRLVPAGHFVVGAIRSRRCGPAAATPSGTPSGARTSRAEPDAVPGPRVRRRPARGDRVRALSPAVNDTFTALTCIDWLGESLCKIATRGTGSVHRDQRGYVRVITAQISYDRLVERAFEKIRQAGRGMPAVMIRQLDALARIMQQTANASSSGCCSIRPR